MSRRQLSAFAALAGLLVLVAAGCGGGGEKEESAAEEGAKTACKAPATTEATGLPAAFPIPGELTLTSVRKDGPSNVVDGYWSAGLDETYKEYKDEVERAGLKVTFTEQEEDDAEIAYEGSGRTGLIALRGDCSEEDTTRVHITSRPE
jgi:hypothetical protein